MADALSGLVDSVVETDVLVVGSEAAGARAAIEASRLGVKVVLVTKGRWGRSGATITAGADVEVDGRSIVDLFGLPADPKDSKEAFFMDIVRGGWYVSDQRLVEVHVEEAPLRVKELIDWGLRIEGVFHNPGHSYKRGLLTSGLEIVKALKRGLREWRENIEIIEDTMIVDLLTNKGRVVGATALNLRTGEFIVFKAKAVILATGGALRLYPYTTGSEDLTGDGHGMAYRVGAKFIDMQYVQFLLVCFIHPPTMVTSINRLLQRRCGWLLNRYGERLMERWDPERMEGTTRDFKAIGVMEEILEGRGAYLSLKHLPDNVIDELRKSRYTLKGADKKFWDNLKKNAIEIFPASHFFCGGIKINEQCGTNIPGLYAAGEVAGGLHGANRLSGNAIPHVLVQGARAGRGAAEYGLKANHLAINRKQLQMSRDRVFRPLERRDGISPIKLRKEIQKLAWEDAGVVRQRLGLERALGDVERIKKKDLPRLYVTAEEKLYNKEWIEALQVENMLLTLELIVRSALARTESRGNHYRKDHPHLDNESWLKNVIAWQMNGEVQITTQPVVTTRQIPMR